jgi:catechol 2,3-dioxygenase-like lactoylglutathione lyase family enzyme
MSIRFHSPVLLTADVKRLAAFYVRTLEQDIEHDFGACVVLRSGLSLWQASNDLTVAARLGYTCHDDGNKNLELCFETETFVEDVRRVKESGARLLHDVIEEPWGQQVLRFFDPDDNLVELGESLATFIRRHHKSGLSARAVSEKTGVPLDTVTRFIEDRQSP